jgi:hypothetical protein
MAMRARIIKRQGIRLQFLCNSEKEKQSKTKTNKSVSSELSNWGVVAATTTKRVVHKINQSRGATSRAHKHRWTKASRERKAEDRQT